MPVLTPRIDIANVRLRFAGGCIANLTASRISRDRVRKIRFFQPQSYLSIDYAAQEVEHWTLGPGPGGAPAIQGGQARRGRDEPLRCELEDFVTRGARRAGRRGSPASRAATPCALATTIVERMRSCPLTAPRRFETR